MTRLSVFRNKRIFITGHSGFKGSWLTLWLEMLGAQVIGYSDFNSNFEHHFQVGQPGGSLPQEIRDLNSLKIKLVEANPDIIFHLAAQPLVSVGYEKPLRTWDINLNGTSNILACTDLAPNLKGMVVITSDKVYLDHGKAGPHKESDLLGGYDPYSASKVAVEMLINSYLNSYKNKIGKSNPLIVTARAGNVIGGGDFSRDRLFPDLFRAIQQNQPLKIRRPNAIRPWQHVLDCIYGYLKIAIKILEDEKPGFKNYNFGPLENNSLKVSEILALAAKEIGIIYENVNEEDQSLFRERKALEVDSTRAQVDLGWRPLLTQEQAVNWTSEWYLKYARENIILTENQIHKYSLLLGENSE